MLKKIIFGLLLLFLVGISVVSADELSDQYQQKQQQIQELEAKINQARGQQQTLAKTIAYLNNKITLTQVRIEQTEAELEVLENEITTLTVKIERLDINLSSVSRLLISRIGATYKRSRIKPIFVFFSSGGFADFFERIKYLQVAQQNDRRILFEMQNSKDLYQQQRDIKEEKQRQAETLRLQLQQQKGTLAQQKKSKQELLELTKNDERRFQQLRAQILEELASISRAMAQTGTKIGPVKKGDVIAYVGNTGCSTGPHLHFGTYRNGVDINPQPLLDSGELSHPLAGSVVTNSYHDPKTLQWYKDFFGLESGHNGIDMAYPGNSSGREIRAAKDGIAYAVSDTQACSLTGTVGKGIRIDHGDGLVTLYWHIL